MSNQISLGLIVVIMFSSWSSVGQDASTTEEEEKTEAPEAEPSTIKVPSSIVFVPHDFGAPEVTEAGSVRSESQAVIKLLVPQNLSRTLSKTPTFYWYVDQAIDKHRFTLIDENAVKPLLEVSLKPVEESGIYSLALETYDVALEDPGLYRWSIAASIDNKAIASESVAQTLFVYDRHVGKAEMDPPPGDLLGFLAENGYWYDLFDLVSRRSEAVGTDQGAWRTLKADLLEQVGLVLAPN